MEPFATVADYEGRFGDGGERLPAALGDASVAMLSEYEAFWGSPYERGAHPEFDRAAESVCCSLARRSLNVPAGFEGASQYSQAAGAYSASLTFANPGGEIYLGKSDRAKLGLAGSVRRSMRPWGRDA